MGSAIRLDFRLPSDKRSLETFLKISPKKSLNRSTTQCTLRKKNYLLCMHRTNALGFRL
jgi:hypothetical protein